MKIISIIDNLLNPLVRRFGRLGASVLMGILTALLGVCFILAYDRIQFNPNIADLRNAKALANDGKYEAAYQEFNRLSASEEFKNDPALQAEAMFRAAHTLQMLGKYDEALDGYNNFIERFPDSYWVDFVLYSIGFLNYYHLPNYEDCRDALRKLLDEYPTSSYKDTAQRLLNRLLVKEAQVLLDDEKYELAYQEFNRLASGEEFKDYPDLQTDARFKATYSFLKRVGADDEELTPYTDFVTKFYDTRLVVGIDEVLFDIGGLNFNLQNYESSLSAYKKVLDEFPESDLKGSTLYNIAAAKFNLGNYVDSRDTFRKFLGEFPNAHRKNKENALYSIGLADFNLGNYPVSRDTFENFVGSFPDSEHKDDAVYHIAKSFFKEGEKKSRKVSEARTQGLDNLAKAYNDQKLINYDEAFDRYTNFIKQFSKSQYVPNAYIGQGDIYLHQNKFDKARTKYEEALQHADDANLQAKIQFDIGKTYLDQRKFKNAIVAYELLLEKYPKSASVANAKFRIAHSHFLMENWSDAAIAYKRVINEHQEAKNIIPICLYQIGEAYYKLATSHENAGKTELATDNFTEALQSYQKILDNFPTAEVAPYALYGKMWVLNNLGREEELESLILEQGISSSMLVSGAPSDVDLTGLSYFKLALTQEEYLKDYKKALKSYQKAIHLVKTPLIKAQSYYRRGLIYQDKLDPPDKDKALKELQTLILEYGNSKNPSIASMVADGRIYLSELSGNPIPEEEKRDLVDQKALGSTVLLVMENANGQRVGSGSGFFVSPGQIATNYHVVHGAVGGYANLVGENTMDREGLRFNIQGYTAVNRERDLVILQVAGISSQELPIGNSNEVGRNDLVYAVGAPLGRDSLKGTISPGSIGKIHKDSKGKQIWIQHNALTYPGNSGCPVLNNNGKVIGIHTSTHHFRDRDLNLHPASGIHLAIPSNALSKLLKKVGKPKPLLQLELVK